MSNGLFLAAADVLTACHLSLPPTDIHNRAPQFLITGASHGDVLQSYNREDQVTARRFAEAFERAGFEFW